MTNRGLIEDYLEYTEDTEAPRIFHRWCAICGIGALLGRQVYVTLAHKRVHPNIYAMLMGASGTRKSSAIKLVRKFSANAGYENFSADKTSKEKFLLDLEGETLDDGDKKNGHSYDPYTSKDLWGESTNTDAKEVFIVADEFNDFIGSGNSEFLTTLGNLWDWDGDVPYKFRLKNSKSISIHQPTVSILGGNTQENFARAFPPDVNGQGFLSRLLLIHGERTGKRIAFPTIPSDEATAELVLKFRNIRNIFNRGEFSKTPEAHKLLSAIYETWKELDDPRFQAYGTRRFDYLLKLCIIAGVSLERAEIDVDTVIYANTVLTAAEIQMPKAMGEFGKSRNSDVVNKIMNILLASSRPIPLLEIYTLVSVDLDKPQMLQDLIQGLQYAGKIQLVRGTNGREGGFLPVVAQQRKIEHVDWSLLTEEERKTVE